MPSRSVQKKSDGGEKERERERYEKLVISFNHFLCNYDFCIKRERERKNEYG